jgi:G:T/U-mismatch repair DNA glycosylase
VAQLRQQNDAQAAELQSKRLSEQEWEHRMRESERVYAEAKQVYEEHTRGVMQGCEKRVREGEERAKVVEDELAVSKQQIQAMLVEVANLQAELSRERTMHSLCSTKVGMAECLCM